MSRARVTRTEGERYRDAVEMTPAEFDAVVCVMSFERAYDARPTRPQLKHFLGRNPRTGELTQRGWLRAHGANSDRTYSATNRAWRNLWPIDKEEEAAA